MMLAFHRLPQVKDMVSAHSLVNMTPWRRLSRSLNAMLRRTPTATEDPESRSSSARSSLSDIGITSSPMASSLSMGAREPQDLANWSQKLSAGFRAVLTGGKKKELKHSKSEGTESMMALQRRLELHRSPMSRRSQSSDGSYASSARDSSISSSEDDQLDADLLRSLQNTLSGKSDESPRSKTPTASVAARAVSSPIWRTPGRGVPVAPMEESGKSNSSGENRDSETGK
jgi:hypothetical protein